MGAEQLADTNNKNNLSRNCYWQLQLSDKLFTSLRAAQTADNYNYNKPVLHWLVQKYTN